MKRLFPVLILLLVSSLRAEEGFSLIVTVTNLPDAKGDLLIGLYDTEESFTDTPLPQSPKITLTSKDDVTTTIEHLAPGTYAIAVIQDLNGNGVLDKNFLGIPKEPIAFSVIKEIPRGKPVFSACSFEIKDTNVAVTIPLVVE